MSTAAATKYQNIAVTQLFEWLSKNPNRSRQLAPIVIQPPKEATRGNRMDALGLDTYSAVPMNPSSILGIFHWIADPLYEIALPTIRATMLREFATALQEKTDTLQGTSLARKRKRLHDWIGAVAGGSQIKDDDWLDFYSALATLQGVQMILIRRETTEEGEEVTGTGFKGEISFATDPTIWSAAEPIYIADYRARWLAVTDDDETSALNFGSWLCDRECAGWQINWPEATGTKESIVEELRTTPTWQASDSKLKKDILAARLGKVRTLAAIRGDN